MPTRTATRYLPVAHNLKSDRDFIEHLTSFLPFLNWRSTLAANEILLRYHCTGSLTDQHRQAVRELSARVGQIYRTEADLLTACGCSDRDQLAAQLTEGAEITVRFRDGGGFCFVTPDGSQRADWLVYPFCQQDLDFAIKTTAAKSFAEREEPA